MLTRNETSNRPEPAHEFAESGAYLPYAHLSEFSGDRVLYKKSSGDSPLGERKKLLQKIATMRLQLAREAMKRNGSIGAELRWKHSLDSFRRQVRKLNRAIQNYNLKAAGEQWQILPLDSEREIARTQS
jgi:hypothetical protein